MDPSKLPTDTEANTLEKSDNTSEGQLPPPPTDTVARTSTTFAESLDSDSSNEAAPSTNKVPFLKRWWKQFNIYLLLFILVILIAAGFTIVLFLKDRQAQQANEVSISTQSLSESALKQLANSDVTIGNDKQILKVESNAIFAGSALVRNDLEVAGSLKLGNGLQIPSLTVSGDSRFNQLQAENVTIGSNAAVQGSLSVRGGVAANGNSTFDNLSAGQITTNGLQLNSELRLTHHIVAGGPTPGISRGNAVGNGGTTSVSGSDSTGSVVINTGSNTGAGCFATITFARRFNSTPHVTITPVGSAAAEIRYYINRSSSEFSICTTNAAPSGQTFGFDYIIFN